MKKAIFLDKDGTIVEDVPYNSDPSKVIFVPYAGAALRLLSIAGYELILISNQSGIGRGYFGHEDLMGVYSKMVSMLRKQLVLLDGFYYCPHNPEREQGCFCRKPFPGLIFKAAFDHDIDLANSWMLGDILNDVEAGKRAGVRTILINNGNETEWKTGPGRVPDLISNTLYEAARFIYFYSQKDKRIYE
jgi:D,D-heptose 1,7-bisphosphate phosphatase